MTVKKANLTKKQRVQNYVLKHPESGPTEIAKRVGVAVTYAGQIRRAMEKEYGLPTIKRGRKAKATTPKQHVPPKPNPRVEARRASGGEFEADMLVKEDIDGTTPDLFRRMLAALGMQ